MTILRAFNKKIRQNSYLVFVMIFSMALIVINYVWIKRDIAPPPWDQAWYLQNSEILYHTWVKEGIFGLLRAFSHALNGAKAPLISILPLPFYLLFGNSEISAMFVNFVFLLVLSYFLFRLVEVISNKRIAFLTVLITQTMPLFIGLNRQFLVEYGLVTLVIMYLYFLIKSDYFQNKKYNILIGVLLGLGLLMKVIFPLYVLFPSLWTVYLRKKNDKHIFEKFFIFQVLKILLIGFFVCAIWYVPNIKSVISFALLVSIGDVAANYGSTDVFSWQVISSYWKTLIEFCLSSYYFKAFIVFVLVGVGSFIFYRKKERIIKNGYKAFLILWFLIPFAIFTFGVNKDSRYIIPVLPVISICIASMLNKVFFNLKNGLIYIFICILIILIPLIDIWRMSFVDTSSLPNFGTIYFYDNKDWKTEEIIDYIYRETYKEQNPSLWNIIAVEHPSFNFNTYSYMVSLKNYPYPVYFMSLGYDQKDFSVILETIKRVMPSFILVQDGINSSELPGFVNMANDKVREMLENGELPYIRDGIFELPHGVTITLFKKINS